jgi:alpha-galactosidase
VAFPPAYLLSFVTDHDTEPLHDSPDLSLYFRSRMSGALGLCFLSATLSEQDASGIASEIAIYKAVRDTLAVAAASLLTQQAAVTDGPAWDVLQTNGPGGQTLVLYAYQDDTGTTTVNVKPTDLQPTAMYQVSSVDVGSIGSALGADLMTYGIDVVASPLSAAHMLMLTVSSAPVVSGAAPTAAPSPPPP